MMNTNISWDKFMLESGESKESFFCLKKKKKKNNNKRTNGIEHLLHLINLDKVILFFLFFIHVHQYKMR